MNILILNILFNLKIWCRSLSVEMVDPNGTVVVILEVIMELQVPWRGGVPTEDTLTLK